MDSQSNESQPPDQSSQTYETTPTATSSTTERDSTTGVHIFTRFSSPAWQQKWEHEIIPGFEKHTDHSVRIEYPAGQNYDERLRELVQSGTPPELYHTNVTQIADHIVRGQTRSVDNLVADLVEANGELVSRKSIQLSGTTHLVPHGVVLGGTLNYREDIYEALDLSIPDTWDALVENARAIDEAEEFDARGFAVPALPKGKSGRDFANWLYNAGGDFWRWTDEAANEVELDFQTEDVRAALEMMRELAEYSPDPSTLDWGPTIGDWLAGEVGQCFMNNAWLAGVAYGIDDNIALNTKQALIPLRDRSLDPIDRGWTVIQGAPVFAGSNTKGTTNILRFMYEGPERQADKNIVGEPMRYLPPYEDVLGTEEYRNADLFQEEDGHFMNLNRHCLEEIAPHLGEDRPRTVATMYARREPIVGAMVHAVIGNGKPIDEPIDDEIARARRRLRVKLEEGRKLAEG